MIERDCDMNLVNFLSQCSLLSLLLLYLGYALGEQISAPVGVPMDLGTLAINE